MDLEIGASPAAPGESHRRIPELRFDLVDVRVSVHALVIDYRNQIGGRVSEVLTFRDDLVISGFGAYGETLAN
ncbi:hypothetical protein OG978_10665 [Streptomyces sp. NBC_01591]|uniref:hypothetical protein n=1 Tax=Streptomyces sp. NBC_01591 TaxID=2975888 RepID=UPI002DD85E71|nr:hypothetical protein [Streptomyces sp. NBC_01591]WSD67811.1 hypothetical protein OG978_10665 [Streptomyces sp. NBC_01591]